MVLSELIGKWIRPGVVNAGRGLVVGLLSITVNLVLFVLALVSLLLIPVLGIGIVTFPAVTALARARAEQQRRQGRWVGVAMQSAYRPIPENAPLGTWQRFRHVVTDPATWLDVAWLLPGGLSGAVLGLVAFAVPFYGLEGISLVPLLVHHLTDGYGYGLIWPIDNTFEALLSIPQGALLLAAGLLTAPWLLWVHTEFSKFFLAPTGFAQLQRRVEELTVTRSETVDAQAAELRRIERDLHDGAQARLASVSMNIGLAEELLARDPAAAVRLLAEARESSNHALAELRGVVRGIHPPVLAERGLVGAVQALGLAVSLPVTVQAELPGRPDAPVESAAYFAIAEALANVVKHSHADSASIIVGYADGILHMSVSDNGIGGADPARGTGLRGIERRLAAFDGTIVVASPPGGPTFVTMELPCVLSSPRTLPSSATG